MVMLLNPSVPAGTVAEFITYAKANPEKLNMASTLVSPVPECRPASPRSAASRCRAHRASLAG
jgi:hypothetical protein